MKLRSSLAAVAAASVLLSPGAAFASGGANPDLGSLSVLKADNNVTPAVSLDPNVAVANLAIDNTMDLAESKGLETTTRITYTTTVVDEGLVGGYTLNRHSGIRGYGAAGVVESLTYFTEDDSITERGSFGYTDKHGLYSSWGYTRLADTLALTPIDKNAIKQVGKANYVTRIPQEWMVDGSPNFFDFEEYVNGALSSTGLYLRYATVESSSKTSDDSLDTYTFNIRAQDEFIPEDITGVITVVVDTATSLVVSTNLAVSYVLLVDEQAISVETAISGEVVAVGDEVRNPAAIPQGAIVVNSSRYGQAIGRAQGEVLSRQYARMLNKEGRVTAKAIQEGTNFLTENAPSMAYDAPSALCRSGSGAPAELTVYWVNNRKKGIEAGFASCPWSGPGIVRIVAQKGVALVK